MTAQTARLEWNRQSQLLLLAGVCLATLLVAISQRPIRWPGSSAGGTEINSADLIDTALQKAANHALGRREGAIIVMDPQTGRVRAVVNPEMAFGESFAPGSTIKPFTALAAMHTGLIDKRSRTVCHEHYAREDFATTCSHPRDLPPLDTEKALAYSCNYYFGKLGERLSEDEFHRTLASFGFGRKTGTTIAAESPGKLGVGKWSSRAALGEGPYSQVTPAQLLAAYAALANGGQLLAPMIQSAENFQPHLNGTLQIDPEQRDLILAGMRGAVRFGTAEKSGLASLPLAVFGKTGTSTPFQGFRTQGWFVGLAADSDDLMTSGDGVRLAVLVFVKRAHGAEAAALSLPIFEEFARVTARSGDAGTGKQEDTAAHRPVIALPSRPVSPSTVRVHQVRENTTIELPFEDYVLGVVATEGSVEDEPEALKALAIAARTYALKNSERHEREGFDFCTTTHCQRFQLARGTDSSRIVEAVRSTAGEVLLDERGHLVESYFGASCGGATANLRTLWGGNAPAYLRGGVHDEYCAGMPHHDWTDVIPRAQLLAALHSDERTDVGNRLDDLTVSRRDETGRAELITLAGEKRKVLRGWDFKIIVGRALGWNKLKSSRFSVRRAGNDFIFRGSGFGHGLGLCQEGAHVMAQRGAGYRQILAMYFPGTNVGLHGGEKGGLNAEDAEDLAEGAEKTLCVPLRDPLRPLRLSAPIATSRYRGWQADLLSGRQGSPRLAAVSGHRSSTRLSLSSEHFRITYSSLVERREVELVLSLLDNARIDLLRRASINGLPTINVNINDTTGDFVGRTGQPWWAAAATRGNLIELQPLEVLKRRGSLAPALRHELAHAFIDAASHGRAPRWLAEGLSLHLAGEGKMISRYAGREKVTMAELEQRLSQSGSAEEMRGAYAAAYREVSRIIKSEGEAKVWRRLAGY